MEYERSDLVVSALSLCGIAKVHHAMQEIRQVIRTDGWLCFCSIGCHRITVATVQSLLNPLQQALGHGCHLNRLMDQIICVHSIQVRSIQTTHLEGVLRVIGCLYQ